MKQWFLAAVAAFLVGGAALSQPSNEEIVLDYLQMVEVAPNVAEVYGAILVRYAAELGVVCSTGDVEAYRVNLGWSAGLVLYGYLATNGHTLAPWDAVVRGDNTILRWYGYTGGGIPYVAEYRSFSSGKREASSILSVCPVSKE